MEKIITWVIKKQSNCYFVIPKNKKPNEKDIYVQKRFSKNVYDWTTVEVKIIKQEPGKNPEWIVLRELKTQKQIPKKEVIEWVFSSGSWNFWFIDIPWVEKWIFVHSKKSFNAKPWDKVKAYVQNYNWKKEAIIFEILNAESKILTWKFKDYESFWFVECEDNEYPSIFIAWSSINDADNNDIVKVKIIKEIPNKKPEWIILEIIEESTDETPDFEIINDFDDEDNF